MTDFAKPSRLRVLLGPALLAIGITACGGSSVSSGNSSTSTTAHPTETSANDALIGGDVEEDGSGTGPELVVLGDSITDRSRERIHRELDPNFRTRIGAFTGEGFGGGPLSAALGRSEGLMHEAAVEYSELRPKVVVLALGTNDAWLPALGAERAIAEVRAMRELFAESCLVAVMVNEWSNAKDYDRADAEAINAELRTVADVQVPALPQELVSTDEIHPTEAGTDKFAEDIADGATACVAN